MIALRGVISAPRGEQHVRGLLLEGRRESIVPMNGRLPDGDQQGLRQFIADSPQQDDRSGGAWRIG